MAAPSVRVTPRPAARAVLLLAVVVALLLPAGPAAAHSSLEGGSVTDGQVLDSAPEELFLDFNEDVAAGRSGLRVYDGDGERVDVGGTFSDDGDRDLVRVRLADGLGEGTYAVTFRVVSADGHPVAGALVFSVGQESGSADALLASVFTDDADRPYAIAAAIARWVLYGGALLAAGAVLALWWLRREVGDQAGLVTPIVRVAALALLVATVIGVVLQVVLTTGDGLASLADGGAVAATLGSFVGISAIVRLVGGAALVGTTRRGAPTGAVALVGAGAVLVSLLLEGHTLTTSPAAVVWPAAAIHVTMAALWLGGLAVLGVTLHARRRADDPVGAGRLIGRASALFTVSVVAVVLAGAALSWVEVRALRAVWSTSYGLVLVAKVTAVLPLLAIGAYNNRRLVPVLTARRSRRSQAGQPVVAGGSDEVAEASARRDAAWGHLRRTVGIEAAIIAVVLALTGVLVALQPAAVAAGVTGAYSENVDFPGVGQMTFTVDPNRAGTNEVHLYLLGDTGRPVDVAESVAMRLTHPQLDIGPIEREPILAGPGHYVLAGPELSVAGTWEITVDVSLNAFDTVSTTVDVVVNP